MNIVDIKFNGRPQKFFKGATSTYCLSFSGCWRYASA